MLGFPIDDGSEGAARDYVGMLLGGQLAAFTVDDLAEHYVAVLDARAGTFAAAAAAIASGSPALIHCTEGKDRTGLLVAVILSALGTPHAHIVADYHLSDEQKPGRARGYGGRFDEAGLAYENYRVLYQSPARAMEVALQHLERRYGGGERYLVEAGGMTAPTMAGLKAALLA